MHSYRKSQYRRGVSSLNLVGFSISTTRFDTRVIFLFTSLFSGAKITDTTRENERSEEEKQFECQIWNVVSVNTRSAIYRFS